VWDQTGSTAADRILLDEQSGDLTATGHVSATRLPEEKSPGGMLSQNESLHATAETMASTAGNANIVYEGKAVLWQGASRLQAGRIEIDRTQQVLKARGDVITQSLDTPDKSAGGESLANGHTPPVFTVIRAPELIYVEGDRLAHYRGGVLLNRSGMDIHAREIRVFFTKAEQGATLDYAVADGEVKILHKEADRTRTGVAEHAEYYAAEEKVVLKGGRPRVIDSLRGTTEGSQLTYFSGSGRLLVDGAEAQPSVTRLHRQ
jgi:lipopolysaccharide export system protein LptA